MILSVLGSCEKNYLKSDSDNSGNESSDDTSVHEDDSDYVWDNNNVVTITLNTSSITSDGEGVSISGTKATITAPGNYNISGTLSDGQIIVNSETDSITRIILDGVDITCSNSAPIFIKKADKVIVVLKDNTQNTLTDGSSYAGQTDNEPNATLFCKSDLSFFGNGTLTVNGNYADGITSKDGLIIKSGTINVKALDDGIRGKDYLIIHDGNLTINSGDDGLKSDNETNTSLGYIAIDSCYANITSGGDAITAQTSLNITNGTFLLTSGGGSSHSASYSTSSKGIKGIVSLQIAGGTYTINSSDDGIHSNGEIEINGGTIGISTSDDGIHADASVTINDGDITVTKSYEAIESPYITVNSGNINLMASNDGFNATKGTVKGGTEANDNSCLYINGGTIATSCSNGDAIDSNGNLEITSGIIVANGPSSGVEEAVDFNGSFKMNGGIFIGAGSDSHMTKSMSSSSTQKNLFLTTTSKISSSTLLHIQDSNGNDILTFLPKYGGYKFLFSSPELKSGETYSIYTGGSYSEGDSYNGLYTGGLYISSGSARKSFTLSSSGSVTNVSF